MNEFEITEELYERYPIKEKGRMAISMCNATALLGSCKLNLMQLVTDLSGQWNPAVFATATVRLMNPKCCILVFCTGKVVCTGAKSELAAMRALAKFIRIVRKTYMNAQLLNLKIELMTASCSVGYPLNLLKIASENSFTTALNDLFPALRWFKTIQDGSEKDIKITLLVFVNGNIVVTGAKSRFQLIYIWDMIQMEMPKYKTTVDEMIRYQENRKEKKRNRKRLPLV
jgi:transcription initiation factor TFIID TATA-box-binding protein